jgi:hypothetical protein
MRTTANTLGQRYPLPRLERADGVGDVDRAVVVAVAAAERGRERSRAALVEMGLGRHGEDLGESGVALPRGKGKASVGPAHEIIGLPTV